MLDIINLALQLLDIGSSGPALRFGRSARRWLRKRTSERWPRAPATVLSGHIKKRERYFVVSAPYSFYAAGDRYGGCYEREFNTELRAQDALQRLLASPPPVRYKPQNPDNSILVDD